MHLSTKQTAVIYYQRDNYTERKAEALALPWSFVLDYQNNQILVSQIKH